MLFFFVYKLNIAQLNSNQYKLSNQKGPWEEYDNRILLETNMSLRP